MTFYQKLEVLFAGSMRFLDGLLMPGWKLYQVMIIFALMLVLYGLHHLSDG